MTVRRFDVCRFDVPDKARTPQGFLRVPALISRIGVQVYRQPDGTEHRELRLPEEVFKADALESFSLAPLTLLHPPEPVTTENVDRYEVGTVGEHVAPSDGQYVSTTIVIRRKDAIDAVERRGLRQLSCGYECDLDETPGEWKGQRYDAIQRNIRGNHVAIVPIGRAGPEVRMKLDATDAEQVDASTDGDAMHKIKIDGVEFEVSEAVFKALTVGKRLDGANALQSPAHDPSKMQATEQGVTGKAGVASKPQALCDAMTNEVACNSVLQCPIHGQAKKDAADEIAKQKARADVAEAKLAEAEKQHKDAVDPARLGALVKARVAIEKVAGEILGADAKLDGLAEADIRKAIVVKLQPGLKLDGQSEAYVAAAYDIAVAEHAKRSPALERLRQAISGVPAEQHADGEAKDPQAALKERQREMNKAPIGSAKK